MHFGGMPRAVMHAARAAREPRVHMMDGVNHCCDDDDGCGPITPDGRRSVRSMAMQLAMMTCSHHAMNARQAQAMMQVC